MFAISRLLISFILLVLLGGCGKDKKATEENKSQPAATTDASSTLRGAGDIKEPAYKLTVAELEDELKKDRAETQKKYAGKVLELSGVVEFPIVGDGSQNAIFTLKSSKPKTELNSFSITCVCEDRSLYGTLGRNQVLRVRGRYHERGDELRPCEIVEKGPDTLIRVIAEQLAAEFTANYDLALKKYDGKTLALTGAISEIKPYNGLKINYLELKGDGKTVVECRYDKPTVVEEYKVGDTVKLAGSLSLSERGVLNIAPCYPLPK